MSIARLHVTVAAALALVLSAVAGQGRAAGTDCPLAHQPYSTSTPIIDLEINPATRAILAQSAYAPLATYFQKTDAPARGAVFSLRNNLPKTPEETAKLDALDTKLAAVPVTPADTLARCARYDEVPPQLPAVIKRPAILVFDKINGFRDDASVAAATAALKAMAARRGWTLVFSENGAVFNARDLKRFDAVVWNNVSGDALTLPQQAAFKAYIEQGGGFSGIHGSGGDPFYAWDWYVDHLIGAQFIGHPEAPQFQSGRVLVDDPSSAIVKAVAPGWTMTEEWYSFAQSPRSRNAHILLTLDEASYQPPQKLIMGDHPITWTQCVGDGRSFYTALGHRPETYVEPHALQVMENGIAWAAGQGQTTCRGDHEVPVKH